MIKRQNIIAQSLVMGITIAAGQLGCGGTGFDTAAAMKANLDRDIPVGTSLELAAARLKARGFTVTNANASPAVGWKHLDYLSGYLSEGLIVKRSWHVEALNKGGVVTGLDVTTGLVGP